MSVGPDYLERQLPDIFHAASVSMDQDQLSAWLGAAKGLAEALGVRETADAILAAHGRELKSDLRDRVVEEIRSRSDATYPSEGRERELEALCTAIVVYDITALGGVQGNLSALGALSAKFSGWDSAAKDLPALAAEYLNDMGAGARRRKALPGPPATESNVARAGGLKDASWSTPMEAHPFLVAHATAIRAIGKWVEATQATFNERQSLVDEELDFLWWAINGRSETLSRPWDDLSVGQRALVAGIEAGDRTVLVPGPPAVAALLTRIIGDRGESVDVMAAVKEVISLWPEEHEFEDEPSQLLPLMTALRSAQELGGEEAWSTVLDHKHKVVLPKTVTAGDLANQIYREQLLLATLGADRSEEAE